MNTAIMRWRGPFDAERAARARRLARPQPSAELICGHRYYPGSVKVGPGDAVWCLACDLPSEVAEGSS